MQTYVYFLLFQTLIHDYCYHKAELRFLKGRLKFLDENGFEKHDSMRPSMLMVFNKLKP